MTATCDYCHGALEEGATKCAACGAPQGAREATDFRSCPHCRRRLLALGSPACNYCGRALPEEFLKAREAMWQRISDVSAGRAADQDLEELEREGDDDLRRALKSLFDLDNR
jgi:DNA-directed RNA polymerase subunit RPC12/RpoP